MNELKDRRQRQIREARYEIESELYKKGYSIRMIRTEVMRRLNLEKLSTQTVFADVKRLLEEWRKYRLGNIDQAVQLELERIDDTVRELWEQWEKSKTDYSITTDKQKGAPKKVQQAVGAPRIGFNTKTAQDQANNAQTDEERIKTYNVEKTVRNVVALGDVSYISEIRQQLAERRKLLGLYAPEKKELSGEMSFAAFLMESGMIEDAEKDINAAGQGNTD
jgi:hypothetical protein